MNLVEHKRTNLILDENTPLTIHHWLISPLARNPDYPSYKGQAYSDQWGRVWGQLTDGTVEDLSAKLERFMQD